MSPGDAQTGDSFMSSLWVAENLEIRMFTSEYIQEG